MNGERRGIASTPMKLLLRTKVVISFVAVIAICGIFATVVGVRLIGAGIVNQAQDKVKNDLNSAREIYREEKENLRDIIRFTALRFFIKDAVLNNDMETLKRELEAIRKGESLDILTLVDKRGRIIIRSRNPSVCGDSQTQDELVNRVLEQRQVICGTVIVPREELIKEGADLAERAYVKLVPTARAKRSRETEQTSGMMIKAAAPIFGRDGNLLGVLYGGSLLNGNYKIVDRVKGMVYQDAKYKGKDIGTATIFQADVRISTNVKAKDGGRAIGTRVSKEVYDEVLIKGQPWIDRAFVVNDWYIAAYEPIRDSESKVVGILYVGILEKKFADMQRWGITLFLGITLGGMIIALIVSSFLARGVVQPIRSLVQASGEWARGNLDYRVRTTGKDEIGQLGETFNLMASSLQERDIRLKEYASQRIMKSERLATLGQLAAGVAHEINNPLGAVLMYNHLVLEDLENKPALRKNLEKAISEASRCTDIVRGLLDFARQSEPRFEHSDINGIVERSLALVKGQALFQNVKLAKILCSSLPEVPVDVGQMQQVFTNIIINAAEAMEGKGELTVATRTAADNEGIEIEFTDTGCGISSPDRERIFDPFFTTKEVGRGTGLGLSISHGIIARHKGTIEVISEGGRGTSFIIKLPLKRRE